MHAVLSPSAAHRWVNCPGSVRAEQQYPNTESSAAQEGTAAHEIAAELVTLASRGSSWDASNYNQEMFDAAVIYAEDVRKEMQHAGIFGGDALCIEQPVTIPRVHDLNWGTADCILWDKAGGRLIVWDFKYGRAPVDAEQNWQLVEYALGALSAHDILYPGCTVDMRIVQPRAYHPDGIIRQWVVSATDLRAHANRLNRAAELSQQDDAPLSAGTWCKYCKHAANCEALRDQTKKINTSEVIKLMDITPQETAIEIKELRETRDFVDARLKALESQAVEQIRNGVTIPGYSIGYGRPSLKWSKTDEEIISMGDLMGIDLRKPESPITPTQAKKIKLDHTVINSYTEKHQGSARLVACDKSKAGKLFGAS